MYLLAILISLTPACLFISKVTTNSTCSLSKYCTAAGWCENFTSLAEFNSMLPPMSDEAVCRDLFNASLINSGYYPDTSAVYIKANLYKGLINDQLDMNRFFSSVFPAQGLQFVLTCLCDFKGLDFNLTLQNQLAPPFITNNWTQLGYAINIGYFASSVDLYMNGSPIVMSSDGGHTCDETQLAEIFNKTKMNFSVFSWANGDLFLKNIKQARGPLCALAFKNAHLHDLTILGLPLKFFPSTSNVDMGETYIGSLHLFNMAIEQLDATIIHPQVFAAINSLTMNRCSIRRIQTDVFKNMKLLQAIEFNLNNLKGLIHGSGIEWMRYLGSNNASLTPESFKGESGSICDDACESLLNSLILVAFDEATIVIKDSFSVDVFPYMRYTFPNEDFCIFTNYSFEKLIAATLNARFLILNCSCTILWLLKNLALVINFTDNPNVQRVIEFTNTSICNINNFKTFAQAYDACDFTAQLQNCVLMQTALQNTETSYTDLYFQLYDIQTFLSQASNFLFGGFNIGVSVFGLISNLATAAVIIKARRYHKAKGPVFKKDDELNSIGEEFFTYMLANSVINCLFSLAFLLNNCISCVPQPINEQLVNMTICLTTDMWVAGVLSLMKLMGNYTYLLMTMNRYLLVGKDHAKWIETVAKSNLKTKMCIAFISSCLLSLVSVYQVFYFDGLSLSNFKDDEYNSYYIYHSYVFGFSSNVIDYESRVNFTQTSLENAIITLPLVLVLTVVHDLFSYFIFCFFNMALDVMTVLKLKQSLAEKARLSSSNKQDEQMRAERCSVIMVVLNSIVNILLRLPELLAIVFFFAVAVNPNQQYPFKILCYNYGECLTLGQISNSFVVLSLSFNVFFFYIFNKTFKFAFHLFFCGVKSGIQQKK